MNATLNQAAVDEAVRVMNREMTQIGSPLVDVWHVVRDRYRLQEKVLQQFLDEARAWQAVAGTVMPLDRITTLARMGGAR